MKNSNLVLILALIFSLGGSCNTSKPKAVPSKPIQGVFVLQDSSEYEMKYEDRNSIRINDGDSSFQYLDSQHMLKLRAFDYVVPGMKYRILDSVPELGVKLISLDTGREHWRLMFMKDDRIMLINPLDSSQIFVWFDDSVSIRLSLIKPLWSNKPLLMIQYHVIYEGGSNIYYFNDEPWLKSVQIWDIENRLRVLEIGGYGWHENKGNVVYEYNEEHGMNSTVGSYDEITDIQYRFELTDKGFRLLPLVNSFIRTGLIELDYEGAIEGKYNNDSLPIEYHFIPVK